MESVYDIDKERMAVEQRWNQLIVNQKEMEDTSKHLTSWEN